MRRGWELRGTFRLTLLTLPPLMALAAWGQTPASDAKAEAETCYVREVKTLPGSHGFAADFIEVIATDPGARAKDRDGIWALNSDLHSDIPKEDQAMYISKSVDRGETWTEVARIDARYYDSGIDEGLRNGLEVLPGGNEFVITTQKGAFQVLAQRNSEPVVQYIEGPRVPHERPWVSITKKEGQPVRAAAAKVTADGRHMIVGYGYFDMEPKLVSYHKGRGGEWVEDGPLTAMPTDLDIFSMQWDKPGKARPDSLYVGTGDQVYRLDLHTMKWTMVKGVGDDSAIHAISTVGGLHLAACWGIYEPVSRDVVAKVMDAEFIYHRNDDATGPNIRAYGIDVDRANPNRQVVTALTGVYITSDGGQNWRRMLGLPEGEYRTAHFNADGSVIVSGIPGTFLANPFAGACGPRLQKREE